jgi:ATP-dependent DNA helicase Q1
MVITPASAATPPPAAPAASGHDGQGQGPASTAPRQELIARREAHDNELERLDGEKERLNDEMRLIRELRSDVKNSIRELTQQIGDGRDKTVARGGAGGNEGQDAIKNYFDKFEWSEKMEKQMKRVFGIKSFRLAQEGCVASGSPFCVSWRSWGDAYRVCNANMDGRDIICVMPTGQSIRHSSIPSTTICVS